MGISTNSAFAARYSMTRPRTCEGETAAAANRQNDWIRLPVPL